MSDWNGQHAGLRLPKVEEKKAEQTPLTGHQLVQQALLDDDEDPRADCNRVHDPFAFDTNPFGPKANYIEPVRK